MKIQDTLIFLIVLVAGFLFGRLLGVQLESKSDGVQTDTTTFETARSYGRIELKPSKEYTLDYHFRDVTKMVLIDVRRLDTLTIHDTTYIVAPRQYREYRGEDYYALVSGIDPSLDSLNIAYKTSVIERTPAMKRNSLSVFVQPMWIGSFHVPVGINYDYRIKKWWSVGATAGYDIVIRHILLSAHTNLIFDW